LQRLKIFIYCGDTRDKSLHTTPPNPLYL